MPSGHWPKLTISEISSLLLKSNGYRNWLFVLGLFCLLFKDVHLNDLNHQVLLAQIYEILFQILLIPFAMIYLHYFARTFYSINLHNYSTFHPIFLTILTTIKYLLAYKAQAYPPALIIKSDQFAITTLSDNHFLIFLICLFKFDFHDDWRGEYYLQFFVGFIARFHWDLQVCQIGEDEISWAGGKILENCFGFVDSLFVFLWLVLWCLFLEWSLIDYFSARVSYLKYFIFS